MSIASALTSAADTARDHRRDVRLPASLGLIATVLAMLGSWIPSLWGDEAASVMSAERPLPSLFRMLGHVDAVHGSYYVMLHFWIGLFGASPFSVRMPPAIAVGFAVAAVVLVARELGDRRLALVVGIVACILPRVTYMGEETRAYAFSAALAGWATWVLVRLLLDRSTSSRWWFAYGVLMVAGIYAFLYFGLFVIVHLIIVLSTRPARAFLRRWVTIALVAVVAAAPVVVFGLLERSQVAFLAHRTTVTFSSVTVGLWFTSPWFAVLAWVLVIAAVAQAVLIRRRRIRTAAADTGPGMHAAGTRGRPSLTFVALCWLVVPVACLLIGNVAVADFSSRYLSYSAPAAALLIGLGIRALSRVGPRHTAAALVALVVVVAAPVYLAQRTPYAKNSSDWAEIAATVGAHAHPGDAVVFDESTRPSKRPRLALHTYPAGFTGLRDVTLETPYQDTDSWHDTAYTVPEAQALHRFVGVDRVWLIEYHTPGVTDTYGKTDLTDAGYVVRATFSTHRSRVYELVRPS